MNFDSDKEEFKNICPSYKYVPTVLPPAKRIIAIGDLHGDFNLTVESLRIAGVINKDLHWIGGDTIVVQVGDQIDRCRPINNSCSDHNEEDDESNDIEILKLFTRLNEEAGTHVIALWGNHELMNTLGDLSYVSKKGLEQFNDYKDPENPDKKFASGAEARKYAFAPGHEYGKFLGCTRNAAVIIGGFLFAHAGIIKEFVEQTGIKNRNDLVKMNTDVRKWLLGLISRDNVDKIVKSSSYSIFWNRILGNIPPNMSNTHPLCEKFIGDDVLELFHIKSMVIGHTPQFYLNKQGINKTCGNKILRVDIGGSHAFNKFDKEYDKNNQHRTQSREAQVLEIINVIENNTEIKTNIYVLTNKGRHEL